MLEKKGFVELTDYGPEYWNNMNFPGLMKIKETGKNLAISNHWIKNYRLNYFLKIKLCL